MSGQTWRTTDPRTSAEAGRRADREASRAAVFSLLSSVDFGLTQPEAEQLLDGWAQSRIRTAFTELEKRGLAERTGDVRPTQSGRNAQVWQLTK